MLVQVHRAVLHSGEQVVVKVQRPGLKNLFDIDLANLKVLAKQLDRSDENSDYLCAQQQFALQCIIVASDGNNLAFF